ncbi:P-loop containing nucleoside triphosphate hydrolase protein [Pisolithus microcarpus]|nr:P-loop containing nucleoside triphosphate hydrolase protein [Pisolithus microcarpus]
MADSRLIHNSSSFSAFANILDARILRALADIGFARPTLVQWKAIPIALENRDMLVRAKTGSGKTAAYCVPVVQRFLPQKMYVDPTYHTTRALILVPTRELSEQVLACLRSLTKYCDKEIALLNTASGLRRTCNSTLTLLADKPDILIATPSRVLGLLQSKAVDLSSLETLVIDEADLILSYGHDEDIRQIFGGAYLPKVYQSFLMSATMTEDVETLKGLTLRSPAILKLEDDQDDDSTLIQYSVRRQILLVYVILKLRLIKGKCILFVNDVDRCFASNFSWNSFHQKYHTVQEFNKGVYDYIIASDESGGQPEYDTEDEKQVDSSSPGESGAPDTASSSKKRRGSPFLCPILQRSASPKYAPATKNTVLRAELILGRANMGTIEKGEKAKGRQLQTFRYRMGDALRSVTKNAIKEARIKELKTELLNSEKLKYLRHDKPLHPMRIQSHMKHVPKYLLPRTSYLGNRR